MILIMFTCLQIELSKAFRNGWFVVALIIGCVFGLGCAALYAIPSVFSTFVPNPDKFYHPTSQSCFNAWISVDTTSWALLFYQVIPLLCVIPYAWSFASERKNGYISHAYTRVGRGDYFFAKYIAVFLSAGAIAVLPQVLNLVMLACFFPGYVPSIQDANYYAPVFWQSIGSILFYNAPPCLRCAVYAHRLFALRRMGGLGACSIARRAQSGYSAYGSLPGSSCRSIREREHFLRYWEG